MLKYTLSVLLMLGSLSLYSQETAIAQNLSGEDSLPVANQKMLDFAELKMGKKIGNGICADFVRAAMDYAVGSPVWFSDRKVDLRRELIMPGDILYMSWKRGRKSHVAVVIEVIERHKVLVAHQNFNRMKYVVTSTYNLRDKIKEGREVIVYRPQNQTK